MVKRKKGRDRTGGRVTPKGTRPRGQGQPGNVGSHTDQPDPHLRLVPPAEPGPWDPFGSTEVPSDPDSEPDFDLLGSIRRTMDADHPLEQRRPHHPRWLAGLGDGEVRSVMEQRHVLGDGVNVLVGRSG